jgi:hypothetical protein
MPNKSILYEALQATPVNVALFHGHSAFFSGSKSVLQSWGVPKL